MRLFKDLSIQFMSKRRLTMSLSIALIVISIVSLALKGLSFGLDFTGGTILEVSYPQAVELAPIRNAMQQSSYAHSVVQHFGAANDVLIRVAPKEGMESAQISSELMQVLKQQNSAVEMRRIEYVGPQVGEELTESGGLAMLAALGCILIYIALRFEYRFALGAVAALIHDVLIVLGFFSIFSIDFDLTVLAAVLAVIGYSLNDTIVVFDRIRENFRIIRKGENIEIIDKSLNQTLARTLVTSLTTALVLISLFILGGELIHGFATALLLGIVVGTYSSIFVASSLLVFLDISKQDLAPVKKENDKYEEVYEEI